MKARRVLLLVIVAELLIIWLTAIVYRCEKEKTGHLVPGFSVSVTQPLCVRQSLQLCYSFSRQVFHRIRVDRDDSTVDTRKSTQAVFVRECGDGLDTRHRNAFGCPLQYRELCSLRVQLNPIRTHRDEVRHGNKIWFPTNIAIL